MSSVSATRARRLAAVTDAMRTLPERYRGTHTGFDATYELRFADIGRTWQVRCLDNEVFVRPDGGGSAPTVTLTTDADTWQELRTGELNGFTAFWKRRLAIRGDLDDAVTFESLFELEGGRSPLMRRHLEPVRIGRVSALSIGEGPAVLLIHGLGATKASFVDLAASLAAGGRRVIVPDLPGFGASSKPLRGDYTAPWFAAAMLDLMDALGIARADLVGNSLGGRVSIEMALRAPERVRSLALLCPAVAFIRRDLHRLVRVLRPELGVLPHRFRRSIVADQLYSLFHDPDAIDPQVADVVIDEFRRIYANAFARAAFLTTARNIYLDEPFGEQGFYPRLPTLEPPALFVWGSHDPLIPARFEPHVARWLPRAQQIVLERCGHVPQLERPEQTAGLVGRFLTSVGPAVTARPAA